MTTLPVPNTTSRELLEFTAGEEHADHSIAKQEKSDIHVTITCSCGEFFKVKTTPAVKLALRNVYEVFDRA